MSNYERILEEAFGEPIGSYAGDAPVGVRNEISEEVCPSCGMMPVGGSCGCDHSGGDEDGSVCDHCGMMVSNSSCGCDQPLKLSIVEPVKLDPVTIKIDFDDMGSDHESVCPDCGMMSVDGSCGCSQEDVSCPGCGMMVVDGSCGCSMNEVAPPGHEKMVKGLKKSDVDNPYAVAWAHYGKKHKKGGGKKHK